MKLFFTFIFTVFYISTLFSQDLLEQRIRKITPRKKSVYLDSGIFHNGNVKMSSKLKAIRHSFSKKDQRERLVFDFSTKKTPRIYGHIAAKQRKLYVDFFNVSLSEAVSSFGNTRFVKKIHFFPMNEELLSAEIVLKKVVSADIFYLNSPGRLVVDLKE